jgi:hypothetical protein
MKNNVLQKATKGLVRPTHTGSSTPFNPLVWSVYNLDYFNWLHQINPKILN